MGPRARDVHPRDLHPSASHLRYDPHLLCGRVAFPQRIMLPRCTMAPTRVLGFSGQDLSAAFIQHHSQLYSNTHQVIASQGRLIRLSRQNDSRRNDEDTLAHNRPTIAHREIISRRDDATRGALLWV